MTEARQELLQALVRELTRRSRPWGRAWFQVFDCDPYRTQEIPIVDSWAVRRRVAG